MEKESKGLRLYVDDIRNAPDDSWTVARTVNSAISFIERFGEEITHISLDHDISHQVAVGKCSRPYPCDETFQAVARYIEVYYSLHKESGASHTVKITIHTANPNGAKIFEDILKDFDVEVKMMGAANRLETEV